jgi:predicted phage-related endonuclease
MKQVFKLFIVKKEPYLTVDENVSVGDLAIVSVGDKYPTVVECRNDEQINLIQNPKLSLTTRHKVVMKPNELDLDDSFNQYLDGEDGMIVVEVEDGNFKILNEEL